MWVSSCVAGSAIRARKVAATNTFLLPSLLMSPPGLCWPFVGQIRTLPPASGAKIPPTDRAKVSSEKSILTLMSSGMREADVVLLAQYSTGPTRRRASAASEENNKHAEDLARASLAARFDAWREGARLE